MMLYCDECAFCRSCAQTAKECKEHGGGEVNMYPMHPRRRARAEHILVENGIPQGRAVAVLQEIGHVLLNVSLYPEYE